MEEIFDIVEQAPNATLRITVGKSSLVIVYITAILAATPNLMTPRKPNYVIPASNHSQTALPKHEAAAIHVKNIKLNLRPRTSWRRRRMLLFKRNGAYVFPA